MPGTQPGQACGWSWMVIHRQSVTSSNSQLDWFDIQKEFYREKILNTFERLFEFIALVGPDPVVCARATNQDRTSPANNAIVGW